MEDKKTDTEKKPKKACNICGCKVRLNKEGICEDCHIWRKRGENSRE